ncbi:hypothetical protein [Novosphingobium sp. JCM 18896]|uniref:hypothetical protein n=1 Tax=Novosphingobium sp. JCM 18896 TaxID=2989731 RepID=UPI0022232943|nr:hypothetical protein [Novosphingobium sp. JCM 18896]MCW1432182.1 hypothetical protein [Novosphingobium sp. JCM 18896]
MHDGKNAFAAWVLLLRTASRALDTHYCSWHDNFSEAQLFARDLFAAGRGKQIRLLLDDDGHLYLDARLSALAELENVAFRLFNPFPIRRPKALSWLLAFRKVQSPHARQEPRRARPGSTPKWES